MKLKNNYELIFTVTIKKVGQHLLTVEDLVNSRLGCDKIIVYEYYSELKCQKLFAPIAESLGFSIAINPKSVTLKKNKKGESEGWTVEIKRKDDSDEWTVTVTSKSISSGSEVLNNIEWIRDVVDFTKFWIVTE